MGPFESNPFNAPLAYSPFQTVPKKGTEERRVVCDLSFPLGKSVNDGIPCGIYLGEESQITYPKVDNLVSIINDYHLLAYTWRGHIYLDLAIPFDLRTGSLAMQRTTTFMATFKDLFKFPSCCLWLRNAFLCDPHQRL